jgi:hypothetical protein
VAHYRLPRQVLSDNGTCFSGRLVHTEVDVERRLAALGLELITSRP